MTPNVTQGGPGGGGLKSVEKVSRIIFFWIPSMQGGQRHRYLARWQGRVSLDIFRWSEMKKPLLILEENTV